MARHRDVRNLDAEDFESDFDYGSSYSGINGLSINDVTALGVSGALLTHSGTDDCQLYVLSFSWLI